MLAPFVWLFVCLAAGIVVSTSWHIFYLAAALAVVPAGLGLYARNFRLGLFAQGFLIFILGWSHSQLQVERYQQNSLKREVASHEQETLSVKAVVQAAPEIGGDFLVIPVRVNLLAGHKVDGIARLTVSGPFTKPLLLMIIQYLTIKKVVPNARRCIILMWKHKVLLPLNYV